MDLSKLMACYGFGRLLMPNGISNVAAQASISNGVIGLLVGTACIVVFLLAKVFKSDDPAGALPEEKDDPVEEGGGNDRDGAPAEALVEKVVVYAPMNGEVVDLSVVPDETFALGILGQGVAILPSEGKLYSPVDGVVSSIFETRHAICLETNTGAEMLLHIGLETISLKGKYFKVKVQAGQWVEKGDLLIEFNLEEVQKNFKMYTPVLLTNADDYRTVQILKQPGPVKAGEPLYEARR